MRAGITEGEDPVPGAGQAGGFGRRIRLRAGGAPLGGARRSPICSGWPTARRRSRGALLRVAHLLRAHRGPRADGAGVRGSAMGGPGADRLHRVDRRVVADPAAVRAHPVATRAAPAASHLGSRAALIHGAAPRAAAAGGDGSVAAWLRRRAAGGSRGAGARSAPKGVPLYAVETIRMLVDRGAAGGARRGAERARDARSARHPRHAARTDRIPSRRGAGRGALAAPERSRHRAELLDRRASSGIGPGTGLTRRPTARPGTQGIAWRSTPTPDRRNEASTASSRG